MLAALTQGSAIVREKHSIEECMGMITKIIIGWLVIFCAVLGFAPTTADEPPSFGVLSCRCAIRDQHAPGGPARSTDVELGLSEGLAFVPTKPFARHANPG